MARLFSFLREVATTALLVLVVFAASRMLVQNVQVHGTSMLPTLQNGEYVLVDTLSYRLHAPERGDIIIKVDNQRVRTNRDLTSALQESGGVATVYVRKRATDRLIRLEVILGW